MKIHLVNYEASFNDGILSKFANKMFEALSKDPSLEVSLSDKVREDVDINHHINYLQYKPNSTKNTLMVTHIFKGYKFDSLKEQMNTADLGICMSRDTKEELVKWGLDGKKLPIILPAHDEKKRRHQVVAILTNVYPDGCKRAEMFTELAKTIDNDQWAFRIMGSGWTEILTPLVLKGLQVDYFPAFRKEEHHLILDSSDYCLYFGKDEGSMAVLDAKNAGLKIIAPDVGFHKEIGIDYPFDTQPQLNAIFKDLNQNPVKDWTWDKYCEEHVKLWKRL